MPFTIDNIHPLIIHFPIALLSTGLFFDFIAVIFKRDDLKDAGFWCMIMGTVFCFTSNISGVFIFLTMDSFSNLPSFLHGILAWVSTFIFIILIWLRIIMDIDFRYSKLKQWFYLLIHLITVSILFYGSHLGAKAAGRI